MLPIDLVGTLRELDWVTVTLASFTLLGIIHLHVRLSIIETENKTKKNGGYPKEVTDIMKRDADKVHDHLQTEIDKLDSTLSEIKMDIIRLKARIRRPE